MSIHRELVTKKDVDILVTHMRHDDVVEVEAQAGPGNVAMVLKTLPPWTWAWHENETLLCIGGCVEIAPTVGSPWLLGTEALDQRRHLREFSRLSRTVIGDLRERYIYLFNYVHRLSEGRIHWLERQGFTVWPVIGDTEFHYFDWRRDPCARP